MSICCKGRRIGSKVQEGLFQVGSPLRVCLLKGPGRKERVGIDTGMKTLDGRQAPGLLFSPSDLIKMVPKPAYFSCLQYYNSVIKYYNET